MVSTRCQVNSCGAHSSLSAPRPRSVSDWEYGSSTCTPRGASGGDLPAWRLQRRLPIFLAGGCSLLHLRFLQAIFKLQFKICAFFVLRSLRSGIYSGIMNFLSLYSFEMDLCFSHFAFCFVKIGHLVGSSLSSGKNVTHLLLFSCTNLLLVTF